MRDINQKSNKYLSKIERKHKSLRFRNYQMLCECGSGKPFLSCCFRSDHRYFNLEKYLEKLKEIKNRLLYYTIQRLQNDYENFKNLREICNNLMNSFGISKLGKDWTLSEGNLQAEIFFLETLLIDKIIPGSSMPLFQKYLQYYIKRASNYSKQCFHSLKNSQYSYYEVIEVRKYPGKYYNTWVKIKDLFTGKEYIIKDILVTSNLHIWDAIVGRLYKINDFNLFSTVGFILKPDNRKFFNRMLFIMWLKSLSNKKHDILNQLKLKYPNLEFEFINRGSSFTGKYLFNRSIRKFFKSKLEIIYKIFSKITNFSKENPFIINAPDGNSLIYSECICRIREENIEEIKNILKNIPDFYDEANHNNFDEDTFDYFIKKDDTELYEGMLNYDITPDKLINIRDDEIIANRIYEHFKRELTLNVSPIDLNNSINQQLNNITESNSARIGKLTIEGNNLKLTTYSKESMMNLINIIRNHIDQFIIKIEEPTFKPITDSLKENSEKREKYIDEYLHDIDYEYDDSSYRVTYPQENIIDKEYIIDLLENLDYFEQENFNLEFERYSRRLFFKKWLNKKIPLLMGKTPKECLFDEKMRPILIDLIKDLENSDDVAGFYNPNKSYSKFLELNLR
ncbi:MAG: hypothetical protein ACP6IY_12060 [Promethearchaeia archaeon]